MVHSTTRRDFLRLIGAGALTAMARPLLAASAKKPNVVLVMADDQGWGDMAYNGHPVVKTPHFDKMASEAVRFDRFYAAAPVCSPTRASVMTGRHPNRSGVFKWGHALRPQEITIAEVLKKAGYVTGHFGKWHLGPVRTGSGLTPGDQGFDVWLSAPNFYDNDPILSREGKAVPCEGESSMVAVDAALEFIRDKAKGPAPFLAVVWFGSPHGPHRAVEQDRKPYADRSAKDQNFFGEITGMDRAFGKLRDELAAMGLKDDTILWYCSDNGGLRSESSGGRARKGSVYEGGLRVPAILEWPARFDAHATTDVPCVTSDIFPTVMSLLGLDPPRDRPLDGIDLTGVIEGKVKARPEPIGFWDHRARGHGTPAARLMGELYKAQQAGKEISPHTYGKDAGTVPQQKHPTDRFPGHSAWLAWPWKLHRIEKSRGRANANVKLELYNLEADPGEKKDLAEAQPQRLAAMRKALEAWLAGVVRSLNGADYA